MIRLLKDWSAANRDCETLDQWSQGAITTSKAIDDICRHNKIDSQIEDLKTCDRNVFTDLQLASVKVSRAILDVLPDGTPVQIDRRSK